MTFLRKTRLIGMAVIVSLLALPVAVSAHHLTRARLQLNVTVVAYQQTERDLEEIAALRGKEERIGLAERPTQDVIAQVNAALANIGVPSQRLKNIAPEAETVINPGAGSSSSPEYRRQSVRLVLEDLSLQDIGAFLSAWRESPSGGIWTPTRIELFHNRNAVNGNANRYDLTLLISAIYLSQSKEPE